MIYTIEFLDKSTVTHQIITSIVDIFSVLWVLENSEHCLKFTISRGAETNIKPYDFGFGPFKKWSRSLFGE